MNALLILLLAATGVAQADEVLLAQGELERIASRVAEGTVQVWEDSSTGRQWVQFGESYRMSSGVVLDLKLCGVLSGGTQTVCLSQGEVRKLKGPYHLAVKQKLSSYTLLKIFDLDLVQDHAQALLTP